MAILIDGYNLLHATGILPRGIGPATLARSRQALLNFLVAALDEQEARRTTIVFDAKSAPQGLPRENKHGPLRVCFAKGFDEADDLLEIMIKDDHSPKQLTVVSSDHRVQRAGRRRKATVVDSDVWYEQVASRRRQSQREAPVEPPSEKTSRRSLTEEEVQMWLDEFGDIRPDSNEASDWTREFSKRVEELEDPEPSKTRQN